MSSQAETIAGPHPIHQQGSKDLEHNSPARSWGEGPLGSSMVAKDGVVEKHLEDACNAVSEASETILFTPENSIPGQKENQLTWIWDCDAVTKLRRVCCREPGGKHPK
ncbi:hypothetical protein AAG570_011004 [Ranatra chinensis]|uniref:Uncharacterized protein n=1 Tax=Ranatra chinensis TaxID=642074 RepID=A0ABD0YJI9_9HEMI